MPSVETLVAVLLATGVIVGGLRLWRRSLGWRAGALTALAAASATLLYLTLFPPRLPIGGETLVVATAGTPAAPRPAPGERLVVLPEGPRLEGAERVPDLATALRRHPRVSRLRVEGAGLPARDRPAVAGLPLRFRPPPATTGLRQLSPPASTTVGGVFTMAGEVGGHTGGRIELIDPAGRRVDAVAVAQDGRFVLTATARTAGDARFVVRVRDARRAVAEDVGVMVHAAAPRPVRLLLVGAPGPETKYLRRWALDAGLALRTRLAAGGGVTLGDAAVSLDAASLRAADVVVIDDAAWTAAGGLRGPLGRAAAGGLGVVLRVTRPPAPTLRRELAALGLAVAGEDLVPVRLPPVAIDAVALAARRGPEVAEAVPPADAFDDPVPDLARWSLRPGAEAVVSAVDGTDVPLAAWRARGTGRVAVWGVPDSYALWLAGRRELYEQWWSGIAGAVARPRSGSSLAVPAGGWVGERTVICGVTTGAVAIAPDGAHTALLPLAARGVPGCAGFWPTRAGVHLIRPAAGGAAARGMVIHPASALPAARSEELRAATLALTGAGGATIVRATGDAGAARGPAWPWFLAWLSISAMLWWLERRGSRASPAR